MEETESYPSVAQVILRLAHIFETIDNDPLYSKTVQVAWNDYFVGTVSNVTERSLTGVM